MLAELRDGLRQAHCPSSRAHRQAVDSIRARLCEQGQGLADAIQRRNLYFRVSILGSCNLDCPFCHNEGGPGKGKLDLAFAGRAIRIASALGFNRTQFTGGEPLLHPRVAEFVSVASEIMPDVGITTNGVYLPKRLDALVEAGLSRIHISLQAEALRDPPSATDWSVPAWLGPVLELSRRGTISVRLNVPVPLNDIGVARAFLPDMRRFGCDLNLFSILPSDEEQPPSSADVLVQVADAENEWRAAHTVPGRVLVRGYRAPSGIRCDTCRAKPRCMEQSHSLRLGVDRILRPCLATREWDLQATIEHLDTQMESAALLALDYAWPV